MKKKLTKNAFILLILTLIPFFTLHFYNLELLYTIPIIILVFFSLMDFRFPLLFIPAIFFFHEVYSNSLALLSVSLGLVIILRLVFIKNKTRALFLAVSLSVSINFLHLYLMQEIDLILLVVNLFVALLVMLSLLFTLNTIKQEKEIIFKPSNHYFLHLIIGLVLLGGSLDNPLFSDASFVTLLILILYFSYYDHPDASFIYSVLGSLLYFFFFDNPALSLIFPLFALVFYKKNKFVGLFSIAFLGIDIFAFNYIPKDYALLSVISLLTFEAAKIFLKLFPIFHKNNELLPISENLVNNFSDQILKFASFLDDFSKNFIQTVDEKAKLNEAFSNLTSTFCHKCQNRLNCFGKAKAETYIFLKNALLHGQNLPIKKTQEVKEFMKYCRFSEEIIEKAQILKHKYNLFKTYGTFEKTLENQLNGVSNTLRQYVVDLSMKQEMTIFKFSNLKNDLTLLGYNIILFNVKKAFFEDFWLEIGIDNTNETEVKTIIKNLIISNLKTEVSIEFKKNQETSVLYFSVIPKIFLSVKYGYGSLAKDNLMIKGDNYLIKDLENGVFISAISDGMGSGYKAYTESKLTINMIDKITEFEINTSTSLNILNTFYSLKDSFDHYATLDLLEINKSTKEAVLYKMGSTNTYIARKNDIAIIENTNLPFGISDLIKYDKFSIENNDLIILATDGVTDNLTEELLKETLLISKHKEPQQIASDILALVNKKNENVIKDDMTIIVLKVEERQSG